MIEQAINRVVALAERPKTYVIDGKTYIDGSLKLLAPPASPGFTLHTLSGLVDLLGAQPSEFKTEDWLIHVVAHHRVVIEAKQDDGFERRPTLAVCSMEDGEPFPFNRFIDRETFVIGLQSRFVPNADSQALLKLTSSLSNDGAVISEDDGVSQKVTTKQGVTLKNTEIVRPWWSLKPFRTFREIEQPASEFVLRLKGEPGMVPACALFEADGGKWKLDAVLAIKSWLDSKNLGLPIVA